MWIDICSEAHEDAKGRTDISKERSEYPECVNGYGLCLELCSTLDAQKKLKEKHEMHTHTSNIFFATIFILFAFDHYLFFFFFFL